MPVQQYAKIHDERELDLPAQDVVRLSIDSEHLNEIIVKFAAKTKKLTSL